MSKRFGFLIFCLVLSLGMGQPARAQNTDPNVPQNGSSGIDPGVWAGGAGLVVAIGGLLTNFMNAQGKISQLEMDRLRQLQDDLNAERDSLRASFEKQIQVLQEQNHSLRDRFVKTETERDSNRATFDKQIRAMQEENRILRDRMVKIEAERNNLKLSLERQIKLLQEDNHKLRDRIVKLETELEVIQRIRSGN